MAPIQARIIPVNAEVDRYAREVEAALRANLVRVEFDTSDNSFNKKIREAVTRKIPNMVIIGHKEAEQGTITLRRYCTQEQLTLSKDEFVARMEKLIRLRTMDNFADEAIPVG